jgi:hypothetical protein
LKFTAEWKKADRKTAVNAEQLTSILREDGAQFIPRDSAACPLLQHHLVPLSNPRVYESLFRELCKLNQEHIKIKTIEFAPWQEQMCPHHNPLKPRIEKKYKIHQVPFCG